MAISGNPKKIASDIAEGLFMLSPPMLKRYTAPDFKIILQNLSIVTREMRAIQIPLEDVMALKSRNMKLTRLRNAETIIRAHCKKKQIRI